MKRPAKKRKDALNFGKNTTQDKKIQPRIKNTTQKVQPRIERYNSG